MMSTYWEAFQTKKDARLSLCVNPRVFFFDHDVLVEIRVDLNRGFSPHCIALHCHLGLLIQLQVQHIEQGMCGCTAETCTWTNWIDQNDESGNGDYEIDPDLRNQCNVEKYEVTRVVGGPVYTSVASIHLNRVSYNPAGPRVSCVNSEQAWCKENSPDWQRGIWNEDGYCCRDWKARFCCN